MKRKGRLSFLSLRYWSSQWTDWFESPRLEIPFFVLIFSFDLPSRIFFFSRIEIWETFSPVQIRSSKIALSRAWTRLSWASSSGASRRRDSSSRPRVFIGFFSVLMSLILL